MKRLIGIALLSGIATCSQAVLVIDDFAATQSLAVTGTGTVFSNGLATGGALGGVRWLVGINDINPLNSATFVGVGSGFATIASGPRVDSRTEFAYGLDIAGNNADMNANLTAGGNDRLRILFDSNDQDLTVNVFIRSTTGTAGSFLLGFSQFVAGGRPTTAFDEDILFSSILVNSSSLTDTDQFIVQFDTTAGGDVSLRGMEAVPEPATMLALATGAVALMRRRKRA